jgi:hypothetical protein
MPRTENRHSHDALFAPSAGLDICQQQQSVDVFPAPGPAPGPFLGSADAPLVHDGGLAADAIWTANDSLGTSYWPFMPFVSQLESFQLQDFNVESYMQ